MTTPYINGPLHDGKGGAVAAGEDPGAVRGRPDDQTVPRDDPGAVDQGQVVFVLLQCRESMTVHII